MTQGTVRYERDGPVARITFDRPAQRNAMTWGMYEALDAACDRIAADPDVRLAVLRGAGGEAFVAGTDISQFQAFKSPDDGLAYEARMEAYLSKLEGLAVPTLAVVEGWAVGGGLMIAACCDLRIATPETRFGVPVARTLGNCLSVRNLARLVAGMGVSRTKRMLMLAETIGAEEARQAGFVGEIVAVAELEARVAAICERLLGNAPITMSVTKQALARLADRTEPEEAEDLIRACYGSEDFRIGVRAFVEKKSPEWTGR